MGAYIFKILLELCSLVAGLFKDDIPTFKNDKLNFKNNGTTLNNHLFYSSKYSFPVEADNIVKESDSGNALELYNEYVDSGGNISNKNSAIVRPPYRTINVSWDVVDADNSTKIFALGFIPYQRVGLSAGIIAGYSLNISNETPYWSDEEFKTGVINSIKNWMVGNSLPFYADNEGNAYMESEMLDAYSNYIKQEFDYKIYSGSTATPNKNYKLNPIVVTEENPINFVDDKINIESDEYKITITGLEKRDGYEDSPLRIAFVNRTRSGKKLPQLMFFTIFPDNDENGDYSPIVTSCYVKITRVSDNSEVTVIPVKFQKMTAERVYNPTHIERPAFYCKMIDVDKYTKNIVTSNPILYTPSTSESFGTTGAIASIADTVFYGNIEKSPYVADKWKGNPFDKNYAIGNSIVVNVSEDNEHTITSKQLYKIAITDKDSFEETTATIPYETKNAEVVIPKYLYLDDSDAGKLLKPDDIVIGSDIDAVDPDAANPSVEPDEDDKGYTPPFTVPNSGAFGTGVNILNYYVLSLSTLKSFSNWLWTTFSTDFEDVFYKLFKNPMDAIIGLKEIFVTPPTGGTQKIKLGFHDSDTTASVISSRYMTLECGSVTVGEHYKNYLDYEPYTEVILYLPFVGICNLSANDVIGNSVNVRYNIDVFTGSCVAYVTVARKNSQRTMYSYEGNCSADLPLSSGYNGTLMAGLLGVISVIATKNPANFNTSIGRANIGTSGLQYSGSFASCYGAMSCKTPYIVIKRPVQKKVENYNIIYGFPAHKMVRIGNCHGYVKCIDVNVKSNKATNTEKEEIANLLKSGVYVD